VYLSSCAAIHTAQNRHTQVPLVWCLPSSACEQVSADIQHVTVDVWPAVEGHHRAGSNTAAVKHSVHHHSVATDTRWPSSRNNFRVSTHKKSYFCV